MKIIYAQSNGVLAVMTVAPKFLKTLSGTEEEKMIYLANKDLPTGTKYEIVADNVIPTDRTFRNAWEYESGASEKTSEDL
tara:strand:- start:126 stop:365 length:240 start_codon:yes stop_codon:yes gene_type:complete